MADIYISMADISIIYPKQIFLYISMADISLIYPWTMADISIIYPWQIFLLYINGRYFSFISMAGIIVVF